MSKSNEDSIFKSDNVLGKSSFLNDLGKTGIVNRGNSCYINATIQILSNTTVLTEYLLTKKFQEDFNYQKRKGNKSCKILTEYLALLKGMWEDNCVVNPVSFSRTFLRNYNFVQFNQEDACEATQVLIDALHKALSYSVSIKPIGETKNKMDEMEKESIKSWANMFEKEYSFMVETFYGQFHSKIESVDGNYVSHSYDPFAMITVPIGEKCTTLYDCLDNEFLTDEKLEGDNQIRLDDGTKVDGKKSIKIWRPPSHLLIVIKRFKYIQAGNSLIKKKEGKLIDFPITGLDIAKYIDGYTPSNTKYDLYAICNHSGSGTDFGHYYSFCKNNNSNWYCFNDRMVFEITKLITADAYILCYKLSDDNQIDTTCSNVITIDTSKNQESKEHSEEKDNLTNIHLSKSSLSDDEFDFEDEDEDDEDEDEDEDEDDDDDDDNSNEGLDSNTVTIEPFDDGENVALEA